MNIGKLFMFGFDGTKPTKEIISFIKKDGLGGVILFKRNIESKEQLRKLTASLQGAADGKLLIGVDQEGGRVARLPKSMIELPPMADLGAEFKKSGKNIARLIGEQLGDLLTSFGINLDFAPVLDINTNPKNPVIGDRAFSDDPDIVVALTEEFIKGMLESGIIPCGKHFPGHGDTVEDSHFMLPRLKHDRKRLDAVELIPFKHAIKNDIPALVTANVVYEGVDPNNPATLSKIILSDILRGELGFKGVVFTDDLDMKAITNHMRQSEASLAAIKAGCDVTLICRSSGEQAEAFDIFKRALDKGDITEERIKKSAEAVEKLMHK